MIPDRNPREKIKESRADDPVMEMPSTDRNWRLRRLFRNSSVAQALSSNAKVIDVEVDAPATIEGEKQPRLQTGGRVPFAFISFIVLVILPFVASAVYFAFIASDQYVAEARFAVRSLSEDRGEDKEDSGLVSMATMPQDGFVVTSFIHSTEILNRLNGKIDYRGMFTGNEIDWLSRFNTETSNEEFLKYWKKQVTTYIDTPSGIITLETRAFSPDQAKLLASTIMDESETLINELSDRAQRDMTERFSREVTRATANYSKALAALNEFQNMAGLLTPEARATETGTLLSGLLARKLELESRLFVLKQSNAEASPAYQQLVLTNKSLGSQIEKLRQELAGDANVDKNVASSIKEFSRLETERRVAESLYEISRKNLEAAQAAAMRKSLYLVVFVPPTIPQESLYPHRISTPLLLLLALSVAWVTLALIWASVEDHRL